MEKSSSDTMIALTSTNYNMWKPRMEDLLNLKDLADPLDNNGVKPDKKTDEEWAKMNRKTVAQIRQWIDHSVFHHVSQEQSAHTLWEKLSSMYQAKTARNKTLLMRRLVNHKLRGGISVSEHTSQFQDLVNQLSTTGWVLKDEEQAILLLSSLPDNWETLVVTLSNSAPNGAVTMQMVTDALMNEEARRKEAGTDQSYALVSETSRRGGGRNGGRGRGRGRGRSRGQSRGRSQVRGRSQERGKSVDTNTWFEGYCNHCGHYGHRKRECRKFLREQPQTSQSSSKEDGETMVTMAPDIALVTCGEEACLHVGTHDIEWVIDTAASFHATPHQSLFATYNSGDHGAVKMGNTSFSNIVGIGNVHIQTSVGCTLVLKDVRHVPDLRLNLISGVALDRQGYESQFKEGTWKLSKGSMIIARGHICGTLYKTHVKLCRPSLNAVQAETSPNLWHRRLGHMSVKGLTTLAKKEAIFIDKDVALDPCEHCLFGKQHRVSFSSTRKNHSEILDLVHSDVCGPIEEESLGGSRYFVTFIDDASRKVWAYCLKSKDQVFDRFKIFHTMVERETGKKLKCLRSDNGGEYTSREFSAYCAEHGIRHEKSVPRTPQHNSVAERMNRTIVEKVRCMLSMATLPKPFWGEAVLTACYLINRSPSVPLNFEVPEKKWSGKDISYSHLKVFGCKAFAHVSKELRQKLDLKSNPCIFIGYGDQEFGYRLWDPEMKKVIRSRDVVFHESQFHDFTPTHNKQHLSHAPEDVPVVSHVPLNNEEMSDNTEPVNDGPVVVDDVQNGGIPEQGEHSSEGHTDNTQLRRSTRGTVPQRRYPTSEWILLTSEGEPESFREAQSHQDKSNWWEAMGDEMKSLQKNQTYDLVPLPKGKKALKNKWVFKVKKDVKGNIVKHKARLVVKGFQQKQGIDFDEIFSPVVKMMSIRVVLGLVVSLNLELEQMDVKTAFLHGDLKEEIYMEQPEGFQVPKKEHLVCRLKKSLYGLKQAPRQWYKKFDSFMVKHQYRRTVADHCLYLKKFPDGKFIILLLYVDDMLIVGQDVSLINNLKQDLSKFFYMKDLGPAQQILGMKIVRDRKARKLFLSQEEYVERVIKRFNMDNAKPVGTPLANHFKLSKESCPSSEKEKEMMKAVPYSSVVGSLMYAMVCTRPDIAHAVGVVSRYLSNPGREHWEAVKWILRYLKGTSKLCLCYGGAKPILEGYTDADMAGDLDSRKSTSSYIFTLAGGAVSWQSKLQRCVALSTTEAEYIAAVEAGKELKWLKRFLQELGFPQEEYIIHCDSQSAMDLSKNSMYHSRTKHIDVRYHWLREAIEEDELKLSKIHTNKNATDMLTKVVPHEKHKLCTSIIGMRELRRKLEGEICRIPAPSKPTTSSIPWDGLPSPAH
ncbi:unnamed protein product [Cuscuta epithymum]|uniref:Uncharacterized protein n=1 Tax=Cuscuta epithymum TaxID=186058 RepID=A0AAV0F6L5_9ASTE|nr:unnamed protein product [Cuscuta epithymum]